MRLRNLIVWLILIVPLFNVFSQTSYYTHNLGSLKTSDLNLQKVFDEAEKKAEMNIKDFGKYNVLEEGGGYNNVWLETQPMGGYMYAKRNLKIARNNIQIFMDLQCEDGRLPGVIGNKNNTLIPFYRQLQGFGFQMPAFEIYYLLNKNGGYVSQLYNSLEKYDEYLWKNSDSDNDGCLETWCVYDTGEDNCERYCETPNGWPFNYPPTEEHIMKISEEELSRDCGKLKFDFSRIFPVPIESMDIMSCSYSNRDVLSLISQEIGNGKETYWRDKADEIKEKIKDYLWDVNKHAC